jgi:hypothetical protein
MLKQPIFSPARPQRARPRLFPCFCFASFRHSTGTRPPHHSAARTDLVLPIRRTVRPRGNSSALHLLRPCWRACLSILQERLRLFQTSHNSFLWPADMLAPGFLDRLRLSR